MKIIQILINFVDLFTVLVIAIILIYTVYFNKDSNKYLDLLILTLVFNDLMAYNLIFYTNLQYYFIDYYIINIIGLCYIINNIIIVIVLSYFWKNNLKAQYYSLTFLYIELLIIADFNIVFYNLNNNVPFILTL